MKFYHGTTFSRYKSIRADQEIKVASTARSPYGAEGHTKTTPGFVYLTDNPLAALDFASRCYTADEHCADSRMLVVFEVVLDSNVVQEDEDEKKWRSISENNAKCYRFPGNIDFNKKRITNIGFFGFKSKESCDKYIDDNTKSAICWTSFADVSVQLK